MVALADPSSFVFTLGVVLLCSFCLTFAIVHTLLYIFDLYNFRTRTPSGVSGNGASGHVIVTGGSSGIGLETARGYLKRGYRVTIMARNQQKLDDACKELTGNPSKGPIPSTAKLQAVSCDVSSSESEVKAAIQKATESFGEVDILVNCAGISVAAEFLDLPAQEFERMLKVNVLGSVYPTRAVVEGMKRRGKGHIVFVSSQVAQAAIYGYTAYAASKWALRGLAEALQMELQPFGVTVSLSYPPDTRTPGYAEEMLHKPRITALISETGTVLEAPEVGQDIVAATTDGSQVYTISSGMDGWLLKMLHPGMTPINNTLEVCAQIFCASISRFVAVLYLFYWRYLVRANISAGGLPAEKKQQ